jgi:hypothetical protein
MKALENKSQELRDELKVARDNMDRHEAQMMDLVPRAELHATRKVRCKEERMIFITQY